MLLNHSITHSISGILSLYEPFHWYDDFITQLPFELKLTMPPTDRGGRGYSDEYVAKLVRELTL